MSLSNRTNHLPRSFRARKQLHDSHHASSSSIPSNTEPKTHLKGCMIVQSHEESLKHEGILLGRLCGAALVDCRRRVGFNSVEIREYHRQLGDNPSVTGGGPALGIGWKYDQEAGAISVNEYERNRRPRRCKNELIVAREKREMILKEIGFTQKELASATRKIASERHSRQQTANNVKLQWIEEAMEGAQKKLRRVVLGKKSARVLYDEWRKEEQKWMEDDASLQDDEYLAECVSQHKTECDIVLPSFGGAYEVTERPSRLINQRALAA